MAALTSAPSVVASSDGEEMVEYVRFLKGNPPNRTKVFGAVPYEHWAVRFTARDLRDQVIRRMHSKWGEDTLLTAAYGPMADSHTGFGVRVMYRTYHKEGGTYSPTPTIEEVRNELPNAGSGTDEQDGHAFKRENIPIHVVEVTENPVGNCAGEGDTCQDVNKDYYGTYLPGGVPISNETDNTFCTLAASFNETGDGHGRGWISSGHAVSENDEVWYPDADGDRFGICAKHNNDIANDIEWSFIPTGSGSEDELDYPYIANGKADGTYQYDVAGIVTDNELNNDAGTPTWYATNGRATCRIWNYIHNVGGLGDSYVTYYHDIEAGDSGGPLFKEDANGDACIAAKNTTEIQIGDDEDSDDCNDDAKGTTAETLENNVPGYFRSYPFLAV